MARTPKKPYTVQLIELRYRRPFTDLCADLRAKGMSWRQIGDKLGISFMTAWAHGRSEDSAETERELTAV